MVTDISVRLLPLLKYKKNEQHSAEQHCFSTICYISSCCLNKSIQNILAIQQTNSKQTNYYDLYYYKCTLVAPPKINSLCKFWIYHCFFHEIKYLPNPDLANSKGSIRLGQVQRGRRYPIPRDCLSRRGSISALQIHFGILDSTKICLEVVNSIHLGIMGSHTVQFLQTVR